MLAGQAKLPGRLIQPLVNKFKINASTREVVEAVVTMDGAVLSYLGITKAATSTEEPREMPIAE